MFPSIGGIFPCKKETQRNDVILQKLRKLNIMSQLEGLLQLLNPHYACDGDNVFDGDNNDEDNIDRKKKCYRGLQMILFAPNIVKQTLLGERDPDLYTDFIKDSIGLTASVRKDFCWNRRDRKDQPRSSKEATKFVLSKVFVNNISFKTKQRELWDFFEHFGKVLRATIVKDYRTRRSRGFGFVLFASPLAAEKALKAKKIELFLDGRYLKVMPASRKGKRQSTSMYAAQKTLQKAVGEFSETIDNVKGDSDKETDKDENGSTKVNTTMERYWSNVPEVIFLKIITYFELKDRIKLEKVCKRWREMCSSAWPLLRELHFKNVFQISSKCKVAGLTDEILISIIQRGCYNLLSLDLSASPYLLDHYGLAFVCKKCVNLQEMNLSKVKLKNKTLQLIGKNLIHLKKVQLNDCNSIGEKGMWWLLKDLKKLEHLEISNNNRLNGKCFFMLPKTLNTVILSSNLMLSDDDGVKYLSQCVNLKHLDLSHCARITQDGLQKLFQNCTQLEHLMLINVGSVRRMPSLERLDLLKSLDFSCNSCVNNDTIRNIGNCCTLLRKLNIEACHGNINSECLQLLATLPKLEDLNISYITSVDDACLDAFALEGRLKSMYVRACPEVTDDGVISCISNMENMTIFDLCGCQNVTGSFINSKEILRRNKRAVKPLEMFLGGTDICEEDMSKLSEVLLGCVVNSLNRTMREFRNDYDTTMISRPFFPEEVSEDEEADENIDFDDFEFENGYDDVPRWVVYNDPYDELPPDLLEDGQVPWVRIDANNEEFEKETFEIQKQTQQQQQQGPSRADIITFSEEDEDWDQELEDSKNN